MRTIQGSGGSVSGGGENIVRVIPRDGGQIIIDKQGGRTVITSAQLPPDVTRIVRSGEQTAIALMSIIAAIFILGPFARMFARRMERQAEMAPRRDDRTAPPDGTASAEHRHDVHRGGTHQRVTALSEQAAAGQQG